MFTVSTFTKGEQMVPVLNKLDVRCAVYGNHDFGKQFINVFRKRSTMYDVRTSRNAVQILINAFI